MEAGRRAAALVARAPGQTFSFLVLPEPVLRQGLQGAGLPDSHRGRGPVHPETFVRGGFDILTGDVERLSGQKPRALRDLLAEAFSVR